MAFVADMLVFTSEPEVIVLPDKENALKPPWFPPSPPANRMSLSVAVCAKVVVTGVTEVNAVTSVPTDGVVPLTEIGTSLMLENPDPA